MTANERERRDPAAEPTTVLPETAAQLVELERLQQALSESEERAKSHWEQYLRAVADLDNVRKRAQRDIESANR
jgi:molecular chaperone GrpE